MKKKFLYFLICLIVLPSCGFKIINQNKLLNFKIVEIVTMGDKRVNYLLKNKLSIYQDTDKKQLIKLEIKTSITKTVKEKNIKNEIAKYEINVTADVNFAVIGVSKSDQFSISRLGIYNIADQHSQTLYNEKNVIKMLTEDISNQIIEELILNIDEL